ncbi:MAG: cysteine synthase [Desulfatibacillaceae bacterium]
MAHTILELIGNTPVVEIRRLAPNPRVRILAKLEYFNPGGSIKDRVALSMIEEGERTGELTPDKTVIEATSGNTGIGLALVCSIKGYKLVLAMSEAVSQERQKILKARGAQIMLTPGHLGTDGAIEEVYRVAREHPDTYFMTDQFNNEANWKAHYSGTAREIWEQTNGEVTHLVATLGTSGTLMGLSRGLKEFNRDIRVVGVEPYLGHKIQGLKNMKEAYVPGIFEKRRLDEKINIDDEVAYDMARRLAREEGLFVGMSSGAAMAIALDEARDLESGTIVVILPDSGERYLSTALFAVREKIELSVYNALGREKQPFVSKAPQKVGVFTCGPTAHEPMDLGECRRHVFSDLLCRYLGHRGYDVEHVVNMTDLDENTIDGSAEAGMSVEDFTDEVVKGIMADFETLGIRKADHYPRTSRHLDDMVRLGRKLAEKGVAYEKLRSLYFDISRVDTYGEMSGMDPEKIRLGATVDLDEYEKENPRDFTLFKRSRLAELKRGIYVKSDWGNVLPSWHLQGVALAMKYLGEDFDVHVGSRDLVFPHHENEQAIARALTGKSLARYWLQCDRVYAEGGKMGAGGARVTVGDLMDRGCSGREIRFFLLWRHYRKPLDLDETTLENARAGLRRLDRFTRALAGHRQGEPYTDLDQLLYDLRQGFVQGMDDDLNVTAAMAEVFSGIKRINRLMAEGRIDRDGAGRILEVLQKFDEVLGVFDFSAGAENPEVRMLVEEREKARAEKDFARADAIRDQLLEMGVEVRDGRVG